MWIFNVLFPKWSKKEIKAVLTHMVGTDCLCPNHIHFSIIKPGYQPKTYYQLKKWANLTAKSYAPLASYNFNGYLVSPDDRPWVNIFLNINFKNLPRLTHLQNEKAKKLIQYRLRIGK